MNVVRNAEIVRVTGPGMWAQNTISANIARRLEKGKTNIHTYYIHYVIYLHNSVLKYNVYIFHRIKEHLHAIKKTSFICFKQIMLCNGGGIRTKHYPVQILHTQRLGSTQP